MYLYNDLHDPDDELKHKIYIYHFVIFVSDCFRVTVDFVMPSFIVSEPINMNGNVTFLCNATSITRNASLHWMVDGVTYNMTGTFTSSRGQLVVEQSAVDIDNCKISSSLTVLNVQSNSQGVYTCSLQDNNFTLSRNRSLMVDIENSTEGTYI